MSTDDVSKMNQEKQIKINIPIGSVRYSVKNKLRGIAVIFQNDIFESDSENLETRFPLRHMNSSCSELKNTLEDVGFEVKSGLQR
jgi:hypothetical protein